MFFIIFDKLYKRLIYIQTFALLHLFSDMWYSLQIMEFHGSK